MFFRCKDAIACGLLALVAALTATAPACKIADPPNRPVDLCTRTCLDKAVTQCSESECNRGCQFILDRLAEKEGDAVIACVAKRDRRCGDIVWAECASRVGPYKDGGPPGPPPPNDDWE